MKNNRFGQAAILSDRDFLKIRNNIKLYKYKLLLDLAWYTGERWGALVQLKVSDVYDQHGKPLENITFRKNTRKKRTDGSADTRQVPIHPNLLESLKNYKPDSDQWMFPGTGTREHLCLRRAHSILSHAVEKAGLKAKGISTHSTRRTFITKLHNNGCSVATIKRITGHKDYKSLDSYIEVGSDVIKGAIFAL
jgi:integrase/recombinase XerD